MEFFLDFFNIGRGCRQGYPISSYLFNICVEIMGIMIRQNRHIKGIHIQRDFCLIQYAVDTIMILDGTEKSSKSALDLLFQFSKYSGLKLRKNQGHLDRVKVRKQGYFML